MIYKKFYAIIVLALINFTATAQHGVNLEGVDPFATQMMFVDAMKRATPWTWVEIGDDGWDLDVSPDLDPDGWPLSLPYYRHQGATPIGAFTTLFAGIPGLYPAGTYTLRFQGSGLLLITGSNGEQAFFTGGEYSVPIDPSQGDLYMLLINSTAGDHIKNIQLLAPGYANETSPFYPPFVQTLSNFPVVRFMQTMAINEGSYPCDNGVDPDDGTCAKIWANRPNQNWYTQATGRGVALEYLIDLANTAGVDPWFCIPHGANDDYITQMATMIATNLNSNRKFYIELSNELFNTAPQYPQSSWATQAGQAIWPGATAENARLNFIAHRSGRIFDIFRTVLGVQDYNNRMVKVMPGWLAHASQNHTLLAALDDAVINPWGTDADVLAVGAYFGYPTADEIYQEMLNGTLNINTLTPADVVARARETISVDRQDPLHPGEIDHSLATLMGQSADVADLHQVTLVAYEGGQHMVQNNGSDPTLATLLNQANRHENMYEAYNHMFDTWFARGGLFVGYTLVHSYGPGGSWGLLEWTGQDTVANPAPKLRAFLDRLNPPTP